MSSWIWQAWRRGRLTTRFPDVPPTDEEIPPTARFPVLSSLPPDDATRRSQACPSEAISEDGIDQGRCIRCARCLLPGDHPSGRWDGISTTLEGLRDSATGGSAPQPRPAWGSSFARSVHVLPIDVGSCQACNLEVLALNNPYYDASRLGIFFTNSPRHADILLVMGVPTEAMREPFRRTLAAMPAPTAVLAVGACTISGGLFRELPGRWPLSEEASNVTYLPGCPPAPLQILSAIRRLAGAARAPGERR
jgi:Ni,Fe-hydrogenase III small subunit